MKNQNSLFLRISATESKEQNRFYFKDLLNMVLPVPQGSIFGPLLLNIDICDLFLLNEDVKFASYDSYTTFFQYRKRL